MCCLQDGHEHGEPQFLCTQERVGIGVPFAALDVVEVTHDNKDPSHLKAISILLGDDGVFETHSKAEPSNKAMMLLKHIMVSTIQRVSHCVAKLSSG